MSKKLYQNYKLLRTSTFSKITYLLTAKETIIILLKLGYTNRKYYSTEPIAKFLNIEKNKAIKTSKELLFLYKKRKNKYTKINNNK